MGMLSSRKAHRPEPVAVLGLRRYNSDGDERHRHHPGLVALSGYPVSGQIKNHAQACVHLVDQVGRKNTDLLKQETAVDRGDLGDVDDGSGSEAASSGSHQDIAGRTRQQLVGRQSRNDDRLDPATIEGVGLDDQHRPSEGRR